ncbi:MAG: hypothetical protein WCA77_05925 [Thermoplasmata archaeon]
MRARGIGRERFAAYLSDYLVTLGYDVERSETQEPVESVLTARLIRMNPSVPGCATHLKFRLYPTSGGAAAVWVAPNEIPEAERTRMGRLVREMVTYLERTVATESHATAKVAPPPGTQLPWVHPP